jgi:hypothetical protein
VHRGNQDGGIRLSPIIESVQDFLVRLDACTLMSGSRFGCELSVANGARGRDAPVQFYVQDVSFHTADGRAVSPVVMQLGTQQAVEVGGLIVSEWIKPGNVESLIIVFDRVPPGATYGELQLSVTAGSAPTSLSYRGIPIDQ